MCAAHASGDSTSTVTNRDRNGGQPRPAGAPLDADEIRSLLDTLGRATFRDVSVFDDIDSTNRWIADRLASSGARGAVCLAERQSQGRGRRGREWCSPAGGNIYLSLGWRFACAPCGLSGLGLVAGVVVADAIADEGIANIGLKWPNDLMAGGAKLGGILVESTATADATRAAIGIGLNVALPDDVRTAIGQPVTDLQAVAGCPVHRAHIVARIINGFADALPRFERDGLSAFRHRWSVLDRTCDSDVMLDDGRGQRAGHAVGIDDHGALLVHTENGIERVHAGDVSLRVTS